MLEGKQIAPSPNGLSNTRSLRGSLAKRRMSSQEIISKDMQRQRGGEVGFLLGKARRQTCKPSHSRSHGQCESHGSGWDALITEGKKRIAEIQAAVQHFEQNKAKGVPYFGEQGVRENESDNAYTRESTVAALKN
jgi:hypothetical protein